MSVHIHTIDENRHRDFLNEKRKDVFSKQELKAGDQIVFCAGCKCAFLVASWEAMGNQHRNCSAETLAEFPTFKIKFTDAELKDEIESLTIQNSLLETQIQSLRSQNQRLERENKSELKTQTQNKQIRTLGIFRNLLISIVLGLGVFSFYQYRNIEMIKNSKFYLNDNLNKLEQQKSEISQVLDTLDSNLSAVIKNSDCYGDESQPTDIEDKVVLLESRQKCLIQEHDQYKKESNDYRQERNNYRQQRDDYEEKYKHTTENFNQMIVLILDNNSMALNFLCWHGSLNGYAQKAILVCEKAVDRNPNSPEIIDSRGLSKALTGDYQGAIEDFQVFVEWTNNDQQRKKREDWIKDLKARKNPFTPEVLETLKYE